MRKHKLIGCLLVISILLSLCSCLGVSEEEGGNASELNIFGLYEEEDWNVHTVDWFGINGRVQVLERPAYDCLYEVDGPYVYPLESDAYTVTYKYYCLEDQKEDTYIQYTLYDYEPVGDWLYTYGTSYYVKVQVDTMEMVQYKTKEEIPTEERVYFEALMDTSPLKAVDLWDVTTFERYKDCTVTPQGDIIYKNQKLATLGEKIHDGFDDDTIVSCESYFGFDLNLWQQVADAYRAERVQTIPMPRTLSVWVQENFENFQNEEWLTTQGFSVAYNGYRAVSYDLSGERMTNRSLAAITVGVQNSERLDMTESLNEQATIENNGGSDEDVQYVCELLFEQDNGAYVH
ncbi:MAG: hypothetical protein IJB27_00310, partial [Clostridia bacterium]|nr:hypothetical protein [Clostridia bacterium]